MARITISAWAIFRDVMAVSRVHHQWAQRAKVAMREVLLRCAPVEVTFEGGICVCGECACAELRSGLAFFQWVLNTGGGNGMETFVPPRYAATQCS